MVRYFSSLWRTAVLFLREQPDMVFIQNPSLVLALFSVCYGKIFKIPIIVDAHNAGLFAYDSWWLPHRVAKYVVRAATLTIVTNESLKAYVGRNRGTAFVLPDPIPLFAGSVERISLPGTYNVLFICSYASDEPYIEVINAARQLEPTVFIYVTGNPKGKIDGFRGVMPENVIITGYLSEVDYVRLLVSVDIVIDLTSRENCLLCGAYEAVAAEKPAILSDTKVLRDFFYKGVLYVDNTSDGIVDKLKEALGNMDKLQSEIRELKKEKIARWDDQKEALEVILDGIQGSGPTDACS